LLRCSSRKSRRCRERIGTCEAFSHVRERRGVLGGGGKVALLVEVVVQVIEFFAVAPNGVALPRCRRRTSSLGYSSGSCKTGSSICVSHVA
jgi:hypothetical protein